MDNSELLLEITTRTEAALTRHIELDGKRLEKIEEKLDEQGGDISLLQKDVALTQQRNATITGFIAMIVAAFVSFFANMLGTRG